MFLPVKIPSRVSMLAAGLLMSVVGCGTGHQGSVGQHDLLQKYIDAVEQNKPAMAYALLHDRIRRRVSKAEFISRWKTVRKEMKVQIKQLRARMEKPIQARAKVSYESGVQAKLSTSLKDSKWRIDEGISVSFQTTTPVDALRTFIRAVRAGQYKTVLSLLAENTRKEVKQYFDEMEKALDQEIEVTGNRAHLSFGKEYRVRLVREKDQWKILDFK